MPEKLNPPTPTPCIHADVEIRTRDMHGYIHCNDCNRSYHPAEILAAWAVRIKLLEAFIENQNPNKTHAVMAKPLDEILSNLAKPKPKRKGR